MRREGDLGIPRLGEEGDHQRCLPSAPWRFSRGRFLLVFTLPTRGPRVLLLKGRASSKGSEKSAVPVHGPRVHRVVGDGSETQHPQKALDELPRSHHSLVLSL